MISRDYACGLLRTMVEIPSFSGSEAALAAFLKHEMQILGFEAEVDEAGNVIGAIGNATDPIVVLLGHMDTVYGFPAVVEKDAKLFGRGSVDAKGPLATFICSAANSRNLPMRLLVIGAVEEETTSRGAKVLLSRYAPRAVFIGEPSGVSGISIGYKGQIKGTYSVTCRPEHSAGPNMNAFEELVSFWNALEGYCHAAATTARAFERLTASIAAIEGNGEHAVLKFDVRIPPSVSLEAVLDSVSALAKAGTVSLCDIMPATVQSQNTSPVRCLRRAIRCHGLEPKVKLKTGTCDMNTVCTQWSAPLVAYGPGDSALDHTPDEHVSLDEYWSAIQILTNSLALLSVELVPGVGRA